MLESEDVQKVSYCVSLWALFRITFCSLLADHQPSVWTPLMEHPCTVIRSLAWVKQGAVKQWELLQKTTYMFATNRMFNAWGSLCLKHVASCALKEGKGSTLKTSMQGRGVMIIHSHSKHFIPGDSKGACDRLNCHLISDKSLSVPTFKRQDSLHLLDVTDEPLCLHLRLKVIL